MTSVEARLDRRIEVLTRLVDDGPDAFAGPDGASVDVAPPRSLNQCRKWRDEALGIEPIGDPASFTRNHVRHGSKVKEIEGLIRRLPRTGGRARRLSATAENEELRRQLANKSDLVTKLVGQLAAKDQELRVERALRLDTERVLRQARDRERKAAEARGAKRLALVETDVR